MGEDVAAGDQLKLFILAGEPSGDRIAGDLVRSLRERVSVELLGVGGEALAAHGRQCRHSWP